MKFHSHSVSFQLDIHFTFIQPATQSTHGYSVQQARANILQAGRTCILSIMCKRNSSRSRREMWYRASAASRINVGDYRNMHFHNYVVCARNRQEVYRRLFDSSIDACRLLGKSKVLVCAKSSSLFNVFLTSNTSESFGINDSAATTISLCHQLSRSIGRGQYRQQHVCC